MSTLTLPEAIGLCPVHGDEFYLPLDLPLRSPFVRCPIGGCDQLLRLYIPAEIGPVPRPSEPPAGARPDSAKNQTQGRTKDDA